MVRSMYSGVAGMKAHQTKMDTIGNNIANVNTYGFKSSRVSFRDIYYQNMKSASAASSNRGGTNPSQIGYGAMLGSISVNQGTSTMQNTGNSLDVAISGEGFFQVQDADGNIFYTKAGMLDVDSMGNLVDINGNFVLGVSGSPVGKAAGSNRIQFSIPSVDPSVSKYSENINDVAVKLTTSKNTSDGNITMNFASSNTMPIGQKVKAVITSSGINIQLNAKETFGSIDEMNSAINSAITEANGGAEHPAGVFTVALDPADKFVSGMTGAEIAGSDFGIKKGTVPLPTTTGTPGPTDPNWNNLFTVDAVGDKFSGEGAATYTVTKTLGVAGPPATETSYKIDVAIAGGKTYTATINESQMATSGSALFTSGDTGDTITLTYPTAQTLNNSLKFGDTAGAATSTPTTGTATKSTASKDLGFGGAPFKLTGGTAGGPQTVADLTGISIGSDGVVVGNHAVHGLLELGRIDLATFANPKGLEQAGSTYFKVSTNSGDPKQAKAGESGTGALSGGSLEMSNVDLSNEFADMITTQRGFQANSRLITVSDTMLEELINLKR